MTATNCVICVKHVIHIQNNVFVYNACWFNKIICVTLYKRLKQQTCICRQTWSRWHMLIQDMDTHELSLQDAPGRLDSWLFHHIQEIYGRKQLCFIYVGYSVHTIKLRCCRISEFISKMLRFYSYFDIFLTRRNNSHRTYLKTCSISLWPGDNLRKLSCTLWLDC